MTEEALADFLLARIAEDERRVDEIPDWSCTGSARGDGWGNRGQECPLCDRYMFDGTESATEDAWWQHLEDVHRRTRVLAECEAKRRIVELHQYLLARPRRDDVDDSTLALLALPYADHPGYDEAWRV